MKLINENTLGMSTGEYAQFNATNYRFDSAQKIKSVNIENFKNNILFDETISDIEKLEIFLRIIKDEKLSNPIKENFSIKNLERLLFFSKNSTVASSYDKNIKDVISTLKNIPLEAFMYLCHTNKSRQKQHGPCSHQVSIVKLIEEHEPQLTEKGIQVFKQPRKEDLKKINLKLHDMFYDGNVTTKKKGAPETIDFLFFRRSTNEIWVVSHKKSPDETGGSQTNNKERATSLQKAIQDLNDPNIQIVCCSDGDSVLELALDNVCPTSFHKELAERFNTEEFRTFPNFLKLLLS